MLAPYRARIAYAPLRRVERVVGKVCSMATKKGSMWWRPIDTVRNGSATGSRMIRPAPVKRSPKHRRRAACVDRRGASRPGRPRALPAPKAWPTAGHGSAGRGGRSRRPYRVLRGRLRRLPGSPSPRRRTVLSRRHCRCSKNPTSPRGRHGLKPAVDVELAQDALHVVAHRGDADEETLGDRPGAPHAHRFTAPRPRPRGPALRPAARRAFPAPRARRPRRSPSC